MRNTDKPTLLDQWEHQSIQYRIVDQYDSYERTLTVENHTRSDAMKRPIWNEVMSIRPERRSGSRLGDTVDGVLLLRLVELLKNKTRPPPPPPTPSPIFEPRVLPPPPEPKAPSQSQASEGAHLIDQWGQQPTHYRIVDCSDIGSIVLEMHKRNDAMGEEVWDTVRIITEKSLDEDDDLPTIERALIRRIIQILRRS